MIQNAGNSHHTIRAKFKLKRVSKNTEHFRHLSLSSYWYQAVVAHGYS